MSEMRTRVDETDTRPAEGLPELQTAEVGSAEQVGGKDYDEENGEKVKGLVIITALLLSANVFGADGPAMFTCSRLNGRGWQALSLQSKLFYLRGAFDGMQSGVPVSKFFSEKFTISESAAALDTLYRQPENRLIEIIDGLYIVTLKFNGSEQGDIDQTTAAARRVASMCSEHHSEDSRK
jgi:hypothetical protein